MTKLPLELLDRSRLHLELFVVNVCVGRVVVLAAQGFSRQVVLTGRDRTTSLFLPLAGKLFGLTKIGLKFFLLRDHVGDLLAGRLDVALHVAQDLIEHLLGIFGSIQRVVDVGAKQSGQPIHDSHSSPPPCVSRPRWCRHHARTPVFALCAAEILRLF